MVQGKDKDWDKDRLCGKMNHFRTNHRNTRRAIATSLGSLRASVSRKACVRTLSWAMHRPRLKSPTPNETLSSRAIRSQTKAGRSNSSLGNVWTGAQATLASRSMTITTVMVMDAQRTAILKEAIELPLSRDTHQWVRHQRLIATHSKISYHQPWVSLVEDPITQTCTSKDTRSTMVTPQVQSFLVTFPSSCRLRLRPLPILDRMVCTRRTPWMDRLTRRWRTPESTQCLSRMSLQISPWDNGVPRSRAIQTSISTKRTSSGSNIVHHNPSQYLHLQSSISDRQCDHLTCRRSPHRQWHTLKPRPKPRLLRPSTVTIHHIIMEPPRVSTSSHLEPIAEVFSH